MGKNTRKLREFCVRQEKWEPCNIPIEIHENVTILKMLGNLWGIPHTCHVHAILSLWEHKQD